jgi:phosphoglycolate phosphatase-like HAD superfamily hydrolase
MPQVRVLIFDLMALAPIQIKYDQILEIMANEYKSLIDSSSKDVFRQLTLVKEKLPRNDQQSFMERFSKLLDEIEVAQIDRFQPYMGVSNGLASMKPMKLSLAATSELGALAVQKFLSKNGIMECFNEIATRAGIENTTDLSSRLNPILEKMKIAPGEAIYFCNRRIELKMGKAMGLRTIVLPSKFEKANNLLMLKPDGMIITLEELPSLLSLETFKGGVPSTLS